MKSANHTVKRSTSRIPAGTIELEGMNEVQTFTSGAIGPWTDRAIAILRTLRSAEGALDGLKLMPSATGDHVLAVQLGWHINQAVAKAKEVVIDLASFEKANGTTEFEDRED